MARDDEKTQMAPQGRFDSGRSAGRAGDPDKTEMYDGDATGHGAPQRTRNPDRLAWAARDQHRTAAEGAAPDDRPTKSMAGGAAPAKPADDEKTRLFRPGGGEAPPASAKAPAARSVPRKGGDDPVVGWFVIVDGPGKGASVEIGVGANAIGRDPGQAIRLDFGDGFISRERHATLVYDPRGNKFYLQGGDARNLAYVDGAVVLNPVELKGGEKVALGGTEMLFVALCGEKFSW